MANIKLETTAEIIVPKGTKVISNGEHITLATRSTGKTVMLFTCHKSEIYNYDLLDEKVWTSFTEEEIESIYDVFVKFKQTNYRIKHD